MFYSVALIKHHMLWIFTIYVMHSLHCIHLENPSYTLMLISKICSLEQLQQVSCSNIALLTLSIESVF